jgi:hypothetical protein
MALSRRDLLKSGLLVPALTSLVPHGATAASSRTAIWVIDDQLPDAPAIAARAQVSTSAIYRFSSDPGRIWMHDLAPRLRTTPVAISGYTSASTLFCLHYLARDFGLKLAAIGGGPTAPESVTIDADHPIDLHDPRFRGPDTAHTWLMLPRRA